MNRYTNSSLMKTEMMMKTMNNETLKTRTDQLFACVYVHDHKDELLQLMEQQLIDDTYQPSQRLHIRYPSVFIVNK